MRIRQRLRGLLGIALVWGATTSVIGTAMIVGGLASGRIIYIPSINWTHFLTIAATAAVIDFAGGFASGAAFALLLAAAERRRSVESLSLRRAGAWGFLASAIPVGITSTLSGAQLPAGSIASHAVTVGLLGSGLGIGMVSLARKSVTTLAADSAEAG